MSKRPEFLLLFFQNGVFTASFPVPDGMTPLRRLLASFPETPADTGMIQFVQNGHRSELSLVVPREGGDWTIGETTIPSGTGVTLEDGHQVRNSKGLAFVVVRRPGSRGGIRGKLERLALDGVLALLSEGALTGRVVVQSAGEGAVWLENGMVVGAEWNPTGEVGEGALGKMLVLKTGSFEMIEMPPPPEARTITPVTSTTDLLLRVCQEVDERGAGASAGARKPAKGGGTLFGLPR